MPIGRGIMPVNRFNIYSTQTNFAIVSPSSPAICETSVNFIAQVVNTTTNSYPTGNVSLIDEDGYVLGTSVLNNSSPLGTSQSNIINITLNGGNHTYHLEYSGDINKFAPSVSALLPYSGTRRDSLMFFPDLQSNPPPKFCYAKPFDVKVQVQPTSAGSNPTGLVNFKMYSDNITSVDLPSALLIGQFATTTIPAFTTDLFVSDIGTFYIQAFYTGNDCFNINQTPPGISIFSDIMAVTNVTTTTTIVSPSSGFSYPMTSPHTFGITVTSTDLSNPDSDGYVNLTGVKGLSTIFLGTNTPVAGNVSVIVPANTFTSSGTWSVTANYFTDGYCYASSASSTITIIIT
jgi:hypothetical protein